MKPYYLLPLLFVFSCETKQKTPKDIIDLNLVLTSHDEDQIMSENHNWNNLKSLTTEYIDETYIGGNLTTKNKVKKSILDGKFQKTETYSEGKLVNSTITTPSGSTLVKFEDEKVIGINDVPKESIVLREELSLFRNSESLILSDTIIENTPYYKLRDTTSQKSYLFDKDSKLLKFKYEKTNYGASTTTYSDYNFVDGYSFPSKIVVDVPASGFKKVYDYLSIDVNPTLDKDDFAVDDSYRVIQKGNELPDFEVALYDKQNQIISNEFLKGKVILIDFWATWCAPCIKEFPNLRQLHDVYNDKGFEIVGVSLDEDLTKLENFMERNNIPWITAYNDKGFKSKIAKDFQVASLPNTILVDRDGKILATGLETKGEKLKELLESLF